MRRRYQILAEFAIGFPLLLFFFMGVMQLLFIYLDHVMVKYAAFQAARAYLATMDSDVNTLDTFAPVNSTVQGPQKVEDRAHLAAAMVVTPMTFSGKPDTYSVLPAWFTLNNGNKIYWPGWSDNANTGLKNLEDAWHTTNVRIIGNNEPTNPEAKVIELEVDHDLKLIFPLVGGIVVSANKIFNSDYDTINSGIAPEYQKNYAGRNYHRVTEKCVLPLTQFAESIYEK